MIKKTTYIIGHKNPDTDSCVSAVAFAALLKAQGRDDCVAARAGHLAPQTEYVFNRFGVEWPVHVSDLIPKASYYLSECTTVEEDISVWEAIARMEDQNVPCMPVVDSDGRYMSLLHFSAFAQNVLAVMNPEHKTSFPTTIALITKTLNAQPIVMNNDSDVFKACVLVGAAQESTYRRTLEAHKSENIVAIVSDRAEVQEAAIDAGVRLLIVTSGYAFGKALREKAQAKGVSVIISPYGTSSTSMLIAYSTPVSVMADMDVPCVKGYDTVAKVRPLLQESPCRCLAVVDDNKKVAGIISEHSLLREANIEVILVDHNEASQAVDGLEHYRIQMIIDHHRLGNLSTAYPITFINKPIGSTATIITTLYREARIAIPKDIASLLLCGILSDTLVLQSTTTTDIDRDAAQHLSDITCLDIDTLGKELLKAGSHIRGRSAKELIAQDMKEYTSGEVSFTISQIEVDGTREALSRKDEFLKELDARRTASNTSFAALLVTDITMLSSLLFISRDGKFEMSFGFPRAAEASASGEVYYLKDVVSRKKQLVPLLTERISQG